MSSKKKKSSTKKATKSELQPKSETTPMEVEKPLEIPKIQPLTPKPDVTENLPWVEKYRPKNFDELISQGQILTTISHLLEEDKIPHLLFYGPPGTGKTSTILAVARRIYGDNFQSMILELNASDDRGIDVVRNQIKEFANTKNIFCSGLKLIILDEADQMTSAAQAALRRVIEKYTKTTRFCIICNYLGKIIPALQSRCTRFRFGPLDDDQAISRLQFIVNTERVKIDDNGLKAIMRLGGGDMRKCLNVLQSCHMAYGQITEENVYACTGNPLPSEITEIVNWLLNEDFDPCYNRIKVLQSTKGLALQDIISEIHSYVLRLDLKAVLIVYLLDKLAEIEFRLSSGGSDKLNLGSLVAAFQIVRKEVFEQ